MSSNSKKLVAVIGATGQQGGAVMRALQAQIKEPPEKLEQMPVGGSAGKW